MAQYPIVEISASKDAESVLPEFELGQMISSEELDEEFTGLREARKLLELADTCAPYTRRLLLEAKLEGIKVDHGHYVKWHVYLRSIAHYMDEHRRTEQRRRFILRAELEDREAIEAALDEAGIEYELELAYKGKGK